MKLLFILLTNNKNYLQFNWNKVPIRHSLDLKFSFDVAHMLKILIITDSAKLNFTPYPTQTGTEYLQAIISFRSFPLHAFLFSYPDWESSLHMITKSIYIPENFNYMCL